MSYTILLQATRSLMYSQEFHPGLDKVFSGHNSCFFCAVWVSSPSIRQFRYQSPWNSDLMGIENVAWKGLAALKILISVTCWGKGITSVTASVSCTLYTLKATCDYFWLFTTDYINQNLWQYYCFCCCLRFSPTSPTSSNSCVLASVCSNSNYFTVTGCLKKPN